MAGSIGSLLNVAKSGMFAQEQAIRVIGTNIANVNTTGYNRRTVQLQSRASSSLDENAFGTGVDVNAVQRVIDSFYDKDLNAKIADRSRSAASDEILGRAEAAFDVSGNTRTIGTELGAFFSALEDLQTNPSSIPLRQQVIDSGNRLVTAINGTYNTVASLQRESDTRIEADVGEVNRIADRIAELNSSIVASEVGDQKNLALRDQRDQLVNDLNGYTSVSTIEASDGSILVSLANGFTLVNGPRVNHLEYTSTPSFQPVGGYPPGMDGVPLGHIVYNYGDDTTPNHIELTDVMAGGGGEIAGLLNVRGVQSDADTSPFDATGSLVEIGSRVEAIAQDLLTRFNEAYLGPDEDAGTAGHQPSSFDLNGNSPDPYGMFTFAGASDDDGDGLPNDLAALGNFSYAKILQFNISDPSAIAAALDLDPTDASTSFAPGDGSNLSNLIALRDQKVNYNVGNFSSTNTIQELYDLTVSYVGGVRANAANDLAVMQDRESQLRELRSSVSGVSLDEEFANLINYQRAYQGSARIIKVGDDLLNELLSILN